MSGGAFDYIQFRFEQTAAEIEQEIIDNNKKGDSPWECANNFEQCTLDEFQKGADALRLAYVYVQRIDWLLSGDDGEATFHERLADDMRKLK